jgi:hypothetical protein
MNIGAGETVRWPANAIEFTYATVKARTRKPKRVGSRQAGLALAVKHWLEAEEH